MINKSNSRVATLRSFDKLKINLAHGDKHHRLAIARFSALLGKPHPLEN